MVGHRFWMIAGVLATASCAGPDDLPSLDEPDSGFESGGDAGADAPAEPDDGGAEAGDDEDEEVASDCATRSRNPRDPRVSLDVEVACEHTMFGHYGVSVAADGGHAHVGVGGFYDGFVFDVGADPVRVLEGGPSLAQSRPPMTIDAQGRLLLGLVEQADPETVSIATWDEGWTVDRFAIPAWGWALGIDAATDGGAVLFGSAQIEDWRLRRKAAGWVLESVPLNIHGDAPHRALTPDGVDITVLPYGNHHDEAWGHDLVVGDAPQRPLGEVATREPAAIVVVRADAMAQGPGVPRVVVASGHAEGIAIDWVGADGDGHLLVPDTSERVDACPPGGDDWELCEGDAACEDRSVGVQPGAFAAARTGDGRLWIAAVETDMDRTVTYYLECDDTKGSCNCSDHVEDHGSTQTLRLWELDLAASSATPVWELPLGAPVVWGDEAIDMHATGTRLAISVVVDSELLDGNAGGVRTIVFDGAGVSQTTGG